MATIRRAGFGSVFEVENSKVGIGTTGVLVDTVQVLGNVRSSNANVINIAKLPTYEGFLDNKTRLPSNEVDLDNIVGYADNEPYYGPSHIHIRADGSEVEMVGAAHTTTKHAVLNDESDLKSDFIGGDIVIDGEFTVSPGASYCSGVDQLTVTSNFTVPTGNTEDRIHCHTAGSMRFNEDLGTLEFYTGEQWRTVNSYKDIGNRGRGFLNGGTDGTYTSNIQSFQIATLGNTTHFGDLITAKVSPGSASDGIRGVIGGGTTPSNAVNEIDYFTMASESDGIDFGNLTQARYSLNAASSSTRGCFAGGWVPNNSNVIDYVEIQTLGDALDFGDLSEGGNHGNPAMQSPTRGIFCGGYGSFSPDVNAPYAYNRMQLITIASKGNTSDFGDLTMGGARGGAGGNSVRGVYAGGIVHSQINKIIEFVTIASTGNATVFGELTIARRNSPECCDNSTRAVFCAGIADDGTAPAHTNYMDYITIASTGNAQDFGDVLRAGKSQSGISDSHGGLGGF